MKKEKAKHRFAHAAEQVERLQEQLTEYKSALDTLRETSSSADEVTEASRDLALTYMEVKEEHGKLLEEMKELRQHVASLQSQTEETREELGVTSKELGTTVRQSLGQQVDALEERLGNVAPDYQEEFGEHLSQIRILATGAVGLLVITLAVLLFGNLGPSKTQSASPRTSPEAQVSLEDAKVQILNGVGKRGLAGQTKDYLQNKGVNVLNIGNAPTATFLKTEIYMHSAANRAAGKLAGRLGVPEARVYAGPLLPGGSDITVVIGSDYSSLQPFQKQ